MSREYQVSDAPTGKLEKAVYTALRTWPNTIAGRPNAGNLALLHIHQGRVLPRSVMESYCRRAIKTFLPDLDFDVRAPEPVTDEHFQGVVVTLRGEL